jgi:hypothetical protein
MTRIAARDLLDIRLSSDRKRLTLCIHDENGQPVQLSLPSCWLNSLLAALPQQVEPGTVLELDSWRIEPTPDPDTVLLNLHPPEGEVVSFAAKSLQLEGIATIARYGHSSPTPGSTVH